LVSSGNTNYQTNAYANFICHTNANFIFHSNTNTHKNGRTVCGT
jgi:hypothetical protein